MSTFGKFDISSIVKKPSFRSAGTPPSAEMLGRQGSIVIFNRADVSASALLETVGVEAMTSSRWSALR